MTLNVFTASYKNIKNDRFNDRLLSISEGKDNYSSECLPIFSPRKEFLDEWYSRKDRYSKENIRFFISEYYKQILANLNPEEIANNLKNKIILCHEGNAKFNPRYLVAAWLELTLGREVPEIEVSSDGKVKKINRPPYIKDMLESIMKENLDMGKYHSIQAIFLFKKADQLDNYAIKAMDDDDSNYSLQLSFLAKEYRENAFRIEEEYVREQKRLEKAI